MKDFKIKPIKSQKDYNSAIKYLYEILEAKEGSPEADLRDVLAILVEKYEEEHYPIASPNAVDAIKFRIEQKGLSNKDLIPLIGSRSKVSEVLRGKRDLTLQMIRALHKHLNIPAEILLQDKEIASINDDAIEYERFPVQEMNQNGAFKGFNTGNLKDKKEEAIRFLINKIGGIDAIPDGLFRTAKSARLNAKVDLYALQGWSLQVLSVAKDAKVNKYSVKNVNENFLKGLVSLSILEKGPVLAKEYLANHGIILVIVRHLRNTYLDGAVFMTKQGTPVIGLSLRYDRLDNFWFTLLHEIGHLIKHFDRISFIIDDMTLRGASTDDKKEKEADEFAESALLTKDFDLDQSNFISKRQVLEFASSHSIHQSIVAGRIQYTKNNYRLFSNLVGRNEVRKLFFE